MAKAYLSGLALALALLTPALAVVPELGQPAWSALTAQQKEILAPIGHEWDALEYERKRKWLGIATRYPQMQPEEQQRVHARMRDWARLTPEDRRAAREQFRRLQSLHPEAREALKRKWQEYESLPAEEKRLLSETAGKRVPPKTAAATPNLTAPYIQLPAAPKAAEGAQPPLPAGLTPPSSAPGAKSGGSDQEQRTPATVSPTTSATDSN
jgi:hypothetical protein